MTQRRIVVFGAGGHARVVADALRAAGWTIAAFVDELNPARDGEAFAGSTVIGGPGGVAALRASGVLDAAIAFGANEARLALHERLRREGLRLPVVVHPSAVVSIDAQIGDGSFVGPGAIVNPAARVGVQVIVNSGAVVEHDCVVADGVHLGPRSCLAGRVSIGRATTLGAGVLVRDGIAVGAGTTVGMGAVVVSPLPDGVIAWGCPARVKSPAAGA